MVITNILFLFFFVFLFFALLDTWEMVQYPFLQAPSKALRSPLQGPFNQAFIYLVRLDTQGAARGIYY